VRPSIRVHPEAIGELRQARDYYRDIDPDLAKRLLAENDIAARYVESFPLAGSPLFEVYRHVILPHFPYMLVYTPEGQSVMILAVFHLRREPEWMIRQLEDRV